MAISYRKLNENRKNVFKNFKDKGYKLESYISSDSHNVNLSYGENCFSRKSVNPAWMQILETMYLFGRVII